LVGGLVISCYYLFFVSQAGNISNVISKFQLTNDAFGIDKIFYFLFIVGGSFFIGPDIFSRNFTAQSGLTAKKATFKAGFILLFFAILIPMIGIWANGLEKEIDKTNVLVQVIAHYLPEALGILLALGLLAAIVSSADTCIITSAAIIEIDILKRNNITHIRLYAAIIGIAALVIAILKNDIISLLLYGYSIFTPGIVCPLFIAIWFYKKKPLHKGLWLTAILLGGSFGLAANISDIKYLALIGMAISLVLGLFSVYKKNKNTP
jgi:SSS family solute:Na+ symporter